ncbi:unnamed protein product [Lampetra planeri]
MSFVGKWKMYKSENFEEFMRACKYDEDVIAKGKTAEIEVVYERQGDDFTMHLFVNGKETVNHFTLGKEAELTGPLGTKVKSTTVLEGTKLVSKLEKISHMQELAGDELVETLGIGTVMMIRKFKRVA